MRLTEIANRATKVYDHYMATEDKSLVQVKKDIANWYAKKHNVPMNVAQIETESFYVSQVREYLDANFEEWKITDRKFAAVFVSFVRSSGDSDVKDMIANLLLREYKSTYYREETFILGIANYLHAFLMCREFEIIEKSRKPSFIRGFSKAKKWVAKGMENLLAEAFPRSNLD